MFFYYFFFAKIDFQQYPDNIEFVNFSSLRTFNFFLSSADFHRPTIFSVKNGNCLKHYKSTAIVEVLPKKEENK